MAEILIKAIDATHSNPDKDKRGCYKTGDPVVVMPDGHGWGREEGPPKFYVLKIPGLSVEDAKAKYLQKEVDEVTRGPNLPPIILTRRLYKFDEARNTGGLKTITPVQLEHCVVNKLTGKTVEEEKAEVIPK